jgi:hypothetical protein
MSELTGQFGRGIAAQQKRGVFEIVSPRQVAEVLSLVPGAKKSLSAKEQLENSEGVFNAGYQIAGGTGDFIDYKAVRDSLQLDDASFMPMVADLVAAGKVERSGFDVRPRSEADLKKERSEYLKRAIERYGITEDRKKAAYILPNGRFLDFSEGKDFKALEHLAIREIVGEEAPGDKDGPIQKFIKTTGAIRVDAVWNDQLTLEIGSSPTKKQIEAILGLSEGRRFYVDYTDAQGKPTSDRGSQDKLKRTLNKIAWEIQPPEFKYSKEGQRLEGLTFPDGTVWLVDGNIETGTAPGVFAHELGVHARKLGFKDEKSFQAILKRVEALSKTNEQVKAARQRVPEGTPSVNVNEETLAYLVSDAPQHGLVKRLISSLKKFLAERGWFRMTLDKLTPADLQALAQSAVRADTGAVTRAAEGVDVLKSYAGESAATADVKTLSEAKAMQEDGQDNEAIRQATGWFRGKDKKWRFEIDDSNVSLKKPWPNKGQLFGDMYKMLSERNYKETGNYGFTVGDILDAPELYRAYQVIEDISISTQKSSGAAFHPKSATGPAEIRIGEGEPMSKVLELLLHEAQHVIQEVEQFATGGSSQGRFSKEEWETAVREMEGEFRELPFVEEKAKDFLAGKIEQDEYEKFIVGIAETTRQGGMREYRWELYNRLAGEVEARDVAARRKMTAEERRKAKPYKSQKIPEEDMIVRFGGGITKSVAEAQEATANELLFKAWHDITGGGDYKSYGELLKSSGLPKKEFRDVVKELLEAGKVSLGEGGRTVKWNEPVAEEVGPRTKEPGEKLTTDVSSFDNFKNIGLEDYENSVHNVIYNDLKKTGGIISLEDIHNAYFQYYKEPGVTRKSVLDDIAAEGNVSGYDSELSEKELERTVKKEFDILHENSELFLVKRKDKKIGDPSDRGALRLKIDSMNKFIRLSWQLEEDIEGERESLDQYFPERPLKAIYKDLISGKKDPSIREILEEYVFYDNGIYDAIIEEELAEGFEAVEQKDKVKAVAVLEKHFDILEQTARTVLLKKKSPKTIKGRDEYQQFMFSMSAPAQEARRNTEDLNATKDGQTSTTSAEAGDKAIRSIMETLRKVSKATREELGKSRAKEQRFLDRYRKLLEKPVLTIEEGTALLSDFVRQSDVPLGAKQRIGTLVKQITAAKKPETQQKRLVSALEGLESDISRRLKTQIRNQIKRAAGPKREGAIKRGRYWHEQEKDMAGIREAVHMSADDINSSISGAEAKLDRLQKRLQETETDQKEAVRDQITDAELRMHHLKTYGNLAGKSIDELLHAKFQVEEIRSLGRSNLRAVKDKWQEDIDKKIKWLAQEITGQDKPKPETAAQKARRKKKEKSLVGKAKGAYEAVENSIQPLEHLLDRMVIKSGKKIFRSKAVQEFGSMAHAGQRNVEKYNRHATDKMLEKGLEIFGVKKGRTLTKRLQKYSKKTGEIKVKGDTIQLSPLEAAYLYNVRKETGAEKVLKKMGFVTESFQEIEKLMTPELKAWADYLYDDLLTGALRGEVEAYRAVNGVDRKPVGLFREGQADIPIMNLNSAIMNRIFDANHYRAWAVPSKTFNDVFSDPEIRGYIEQHAGTSTRQALDNFLEDFAKSPRELRGDMAWMDKLRSNVVMSMIGANPTTFFKQLTSIPAYAADIPTAAFVQNFAHGLANFGRVKRMIDSSGMARERFGAGYDRDIHEASKATAEQVIGGKVTRVRDVLMSMTKLGDKAAIYTGYTVYKYHYDKAKRAGKSDKEANEIGVKEFEMATERTQQAGAVKDLGSFQRGGSLQKLLTMYMTSPAAYTRQTMAALRHFPTDPVGSSKRLLLFNVMLPMMFQAVASGFLGAGGEDEDEWVDFWQKELRAVALGPFLGIPIARDVAAGIWESAMGSWYGSDVQHSPVTETTKSLTQAVFQFSKGMREFDDEAIERAQTHFFDFLGYLVGLPTRPGRRLWEGWEDFFSGDTEHPFMAASGYSRSARKEKYLGE